MRETEGLRNDRSLRSQKVRGHDDCGISEDAVREEGGIKKEQVQEKTAPQTIILTAKKMSSSQEFLGLISGVVTELPSSPVAPLQSRFFSSCSRHTKPPDTAGSPMSLLILMVSVVYKED